jgi:hypothetical protein
MAKSQSINQDGFNQDTNKNSNASSNFVQIASLGVNGRCHKGVIQLSVEEMLKACEDAQAQGFESMLAI